jgi:hypothetical protein
MKTKLLTANFWLTIALLAGFCLAAPAFAEKADVFVGYSRLGANTFNANTDGLNGWQGAMNVQIKPFLGVEGDLGHYGLGADRSVLRSTSLMAGPRLTVGKLGVHAFAHGLVGGQHSSNATGQSGTSLTGALGGGVDFRFFPYLSWRFGYDYIAQLTGSPAAASHNRISTGVVVRF